MVLNVEQNRTESTNLVLLPARTVLCSWCRLSAHVAMPTVRDVTSESSPPAPRTQINGKHLMDLCVHELLPLLAAGDVRDLFANSEIAPLPV